MRDSKQHRRKRLEAVQSDLLDRQIPDPATEKVDRPPTEAERQALVERRIQEAMAEGAFDHLPGKGKPLKLNRNPYLEPGQDLAFGLLKNNGLAPEWIERDKEIRQELEAARQELRLARSRRQADPAGDTIWQGALARFEARLASLNRKIDDFNLVVPLVSKQRLRLRLASELHAWKRKSNNERGHR